MVFCRRNHCQRDDRQQSSCKNAITCRVTSSHAECQPPSAAEGGRTQRFKTLKPCWPSGLPTRSLGRQHLQLHQADNALQLHVSAAPATYHIGPSPATMFCLKRQWQAAESSRCRGHQYSCRSTAALLCAHHPHLRRQHLQPHGTAHSLQLQTAAKSLQESTAAISPCHSYLER